MPTNWTLRPLQHKDAQAWRALRLAVMRSHPTCFCTTLHEARQQDLNFYQQQIAQAQITPLFLTGAFSPDNQLLGIIALEQLSGAMRAHRARIWGLMVADSAQHQGIGQALCQQALRQAQTLSAEHICLEVTDAAAPAFKLYQKLGFKVSATSAQAFKLNGQYLDQIFMVKAL